MSDDSLEQHMRRIFAANDNVPPRPEPTYTYRVELRYEEPDTEGAPERELSTIITVNIGPVTEDAIDDASDAQLAALVIAALPAPYQALAVTWPIGQVEIVDITQLEQTNEDEIDAWEDQYGEYASDADDADDDASNHENYEDDLGGW